MKRLFVLSLILFCLFSVSALASTADATIVAPNTTKVTAPYAGTLLPFDWRKGDPVNADSMLFAYQTTPVYAQNSGKLVAVNAVVGDDAAGIVNHYGALAVIEPVHPLYIDADTSQAYDKDENKYLHAGELLYLKDGNDKGTGRVVSVNGSKYTVEVLSGPYDPDDNVRCYRDSAYANDSETGRGKVKRYPDISVTGQGRIFSVHTREGDSVKTGDLLFETGDPLATPGSTSTIFSPCAGVLSALYVSGGQIVYRGQLLCEILNLNELELSIELDEMDLPSVRLGDSLTYTLDAYPDRTFIGTVIRIYPLGTAKQNASYYDVRLRISADSLLLNPGMNGTVTIP